MQDPRSGHTAAATVLVQLRVETNSAKDHCAVAYLLSKPSEDITARIRTIFL